MICKHILLITFLIKPELILLLTVKWFTNNSIIHHPFVYAQLNVKLILFQTIQFSIRHLFGQFRY